MYLNRLDYYTSDAEAHAARVGLVHRTNYHLAFLYNNRGCCIATATNRAGSRTHGAGFSTYTIHAERAVLKSIGDLTLLRGSVLVVIRVDKMGRILGSEPCRECKCHLEKAIRKHGLRRVYFS